MRTNIIQSVLSLICLAIIGCTPIGAIDEISSEELREVLLKCKQNDVTVDDIQKDGNRFLLSLSDGTILNLGKDVLLIGIDIRGYWDIDGEMTDEPLSSSGEAILLREMQARCFCGLVEGYTDWSFFMEDEVITLGKTLFSFDPDTILRGINHRGYSHEAPENTLPAYRLSKLKGFKYVEADVRFTSDGIPVLIHDGTVNRTSDGNGSVNKLEWDEISSLDFGSWKSSFFAQTRIPSLEEFLSLCSSIDLYPYIELKEGNREQIAAVVDLVDKYGLKERAIYISFSSALLGFVSAFDPDATVGLLVNKHLSETDILAAQKLYTDTNTVLISASDFSENAVSLCNAASIPLQIWTIDDRDTILSLPPYVSGVTSNIHHAGRLLYEAGRN